MEWHFLYYFKLEIQCFLGLLLIDAISNISVFEAILAKTLWPTLSMTANSSHFSAKAKT